MSLETLKTEFPIWQVKNKFSMPKMINTPNGDVQVQGYATAKVDASILHQIPDSSVFKLVVPTVDDLIRHKLITVATKADDKAKAAPAIAYVSEAK